MTATPACTLLPIVKLSNGKEVMISVGIGGRIRLSVYAYPADVSFTLSETPNEMLLIAATLTDAAALAAERMEKKEGGPT